MIITTIFLDMDDTLADFSRSPWISGGLNTRDKGYPPSEMYINGFFLDLEPMPGALEAARYLHNKFKDVWILTQPVLDNPNSAAEKLQWVSRWIPHLRSKVILTQEKGFLSMPGRILVDDDHKGQWQASWAKGSGHFIKFDYSLGEKAWPDAIKNIELQVR